ncbi:nuclease-related domain-containing protein [Trinickia terrae]|uniref:nuclease-related domain-containing protein n=1 Tax=Trinickia terrae TaxID=2571161 RepID=UPI001F0D3BFF|nr:nuclease-related domain-containing protein [Trinickia terrae]
MIIKSADDKETSIKTLQAILKIPELPASKRAMVDQEIRTTRSGINGEEMTAYLIDFGLKASNSTMILHDLRLETGDGRVAQIDHLLIHRTNRIWVLETKKFARGVKITEDGEFLRWNGKFYEGMPSPLEQNKRHIQVLREVIRGLGNSAPTIRDYLGYVIVSPNARIDRPKKFNTSLVVKADSFLTSFDKDLDKAGFFTVLGGLFNEEHVSLAKKLLAMHKPIDFDYAARFGVSREAIQRVLNPASPQVIQRVPTDTPAAPIPAPMAVQQPTAVVAPAAASIAPASPAFPREQNTVPWEEYDLDPDGLEHLGLTGPSEAAKLPVLVDADEQPATLAAERTREQQATAVVLTDTARAPAADNTEGAEHRCRNCDSENLYIAYGQYGYYFKCRACAGNTPIRISCGQRGHRERIRKEGSKFFRECAACESSSLFFQNV